MCEAHVLLDWNLSIAQAELAILANPSDPENEFRPTLSTAGHIDRCQNHFASSVLPHDLTIAGSEALEDAREANELRNRVVHDVWIERLNTKDGHEFNRVQIERTGLIDQPSDLAFVHDAAQRLEHASGRVNALTKAMGLLWAAPGVPIPEELGYKQMLPAIRG